MYVESVANPKNDVLDYRAIADVAHARGLPVVCDNTVLTPVLFRPFDHGIDIAVYSATKFIGGHGTSIGGVIVDSGRFDWSKEPEKWPQFTAPDPSYHGIGVSRGGGPIVLHHHLPHALAARPGRHAEPVERLPVPAGPGDASLADAAPLRERPGRGQVPRIASAWSVG